LRDPGDLTVDDIQEFILLSLTREEAEKEKIRRLELGMFQGLAYFSHERTPLQAFGWYIAYVSLDALIMMVGIFSLLVYLNPSDLEAVLQFQETHPTAMEMVTTILPTAYTAILGALLLWNKKKTTVNILLFLSAVPIPYFISYYDYNFVYGLFLSNLPLAVLTTRPSSKL
jgi:hypothetical protein